VVVDTEGLKMAQLNSSSAAQQAMKNQRFVGGSGRRVMLFLHPF